MAPIKKKMILVSVWVTLIGSVAGGNTDCGCNCSCCCHLFDQDADRPAEAAGSWGELGGKRHGHVAQRGQSQRSLGQDDAEQERWVRTHTRTHTKAHLCQTPESFWATVATPLVKTRVRKHNCKKRFCRHFQRTTAPENSALCCCWETERKTVDWEFWSDWSLIGLFPLDRSPAFAFATNDSQNRLDRIPIGRSAADSLLIRCWFDAFSWKEKRRVVFFCGVSMSDRVFVLQVFGGTDGKGERTMWRLKVERMLVARATLPRSHTHTLTWNVSLVC